MSYKSMRESSIASRLRSMSADAGPKTENTSNGPAYVNSTGPKVAEQFLKSEGTTTKARADRAPRKRGGRTMKKAEGGKVKHEDEAEDRAMIKRMVKPDAMTGKKDGGRSCYADGGPIRGPKLAAEDLRKMYAASQAKWNSMSQDQKDAQRRADDAAGREAWLKNVERGQKNGGRIGRADGGAVKGKGSTTINIVMPAGGGDKPMPVPVPMDGGAPPMPRPAPPMPQGMPPQNATPTLALKTGGRANFTAGAGTGEGRLEKTAHAKARG